MRTKRNEGLRSPAACLLLGALLACGCDDDPTPPASPTASAAPRPAESGTTVSLSTGFTPDPRTATGQAGGDTPASTFGSDCRGWVSGTPQHTLTLHTDFRRLRIMARSDDDTTLVIRGPDGQYRCDDDGGGALNPLVEGAFEAGAYQIHVGTFDETSSPPYTIGFSELSSVTPSNLGR